MIKALDQLATDVPVLIENTASGDFAAVRRWDGLAVAHEEQAVWLPVPEGSVMVPVADAMRRARKVADKHKNSLYVDRLFRPRI